MVLRIPGFISVALLDMLLVSPLTSWISLSSRCYGCSKGFFEGVLWGVQCIGCSLPRLDMFERWEPFCPYRYLEDFTKALSRSVPGCLQRFEPGCSSECEIGKERVRAVSYLVQAGMCTCVEYGKLGCTCIILSLSLAAILVQL